MAYFNTTGLIIVDAPPSANTSEKTYDVIIKSTIDPTTNKPVITLALPGGDLTGDINYFNNLKNQDGKPGLTQLDSDLLTEVLRNHYNEIVSLNNSDEEDYQQIQKRHAEENATWLKSAGITPEAPDGETPKTPEETAKEPQLSGQADDDNNPNKQNTTDGSGPVTPVANTSETLPELDWSEMPNAQNGEVLIEGSKEVPASTQQTTRPGKRKKNPLAKLPSYTYNLTLYMITPDAYREFIESGRKKINALSSATPVGQGSGQVKGGAFIIAQSGGINRSNQSRAPSMDKDYYIDNLRMRSLTSMKETNAPVAAVSDMSFTITEPYGFSFLTQLKNANEELKKYSSSTEYKKINTWARQWFILGIRFYGYDGNGKPVKGTDKLFGEMIDPTGGDALFEQFYDITITALNFRLTGQGTVYNIKAAVPITQNLLGIKRGRVPTGLSVQGRDVADALQGENGLFTILNKKEQEKIQTTQALPNKFSVEFLGDAEKLIKNASLLTPDDYRKNRFGITGAQTSRDSNDSKNETPPDTTSRRFTFNNDTSIISAVETIIKKSQFVIDALNTVYANDTQPNPDQKDQDQNAKEPMGFRWYSITSEIKQADWDDKVKDWALQIVYIIQIYDMPSIESGQISTTRKYYGAYKRYDYWFTGKNTEVIDLDISFDYLYFNSLLTLGQNKPSATAPDNGGNRETQDKQSPAPSGASVKNTNTTSSNTGLKQDATPGASEDNSAGTSSVAGQVPVTTGVLNPGDRTAGLGVNLEAQNSVTTYLYDPFAFSHSKLRILGDPDLLVKDASTTIKQLYNQFYNTDGYSINANGGQVFIEVDFKEGQDYQNNVGLQKINENIFFMEYPPEVKKYSNNAVVYMVNTIDSVFSNGKFEQTLGLMLPMFPGSKSPVSSNPATVNSPQQPTNQQTITAPAEPNEQQNVITPPPASSNSIPPGAYDPDSPDYDPNAFNELGQYVGPTTTTVDDDALHEFVPTAQPIPSEGRVSNTPVSPDIAQRSSIPPGAFDPDSPDYNPDIQYF